MPDKLPPAHDVLAAEEFAVPAPDPKLHRDPPRDVLAAEEFELPAPDPSLHHGPVSLPADPTGIPEPHDVLAAEEFALPAPSPHPAGEPTPPGTSAGLRGALLAAGGLALLLARRRHRGKRHT